VASCPATGKDTAVAIPIILDCDPGTDDAFALLLALASPEIDLRAVTVAGGNVGLDCTLPNALALTALVGSQVPVFAGADRPLLGSFVNETRVHGIDGLGGIALPRGVEPAPGIAADAIRDILRAAARRPVTLVGIAPATNLALALMTEPALLANVERIVLMTGAWGEGNATPAAEFNAFNDPEALAVLFACGRPVTLATLELTAQALCTPAHLAAWRTGAGRCLTALCDIEATVPLGPRLGGAGAALHDPCTIAWLIRPELFTARDCAACVDLGPGPSRGRTVIDRWGRTAALTNVTLLETLDADGFFALLAERLSRLC
jgi:inosine-uridine nucleoside N-ribohydrolase